MGDSVEAARLAADLRATTANLSDYIEWRAGEIAAPRIAEAEKAAADRVAEVEQQAAFDKQRSDDLIAELRRHLAALDRTCAAETVKVNGVRALWRRLYMEGSSATADEVYAALYPPKPVEAASKARA